MIEGRNICYIADNKAILDKVSLKIHRGEMVALLGPNGAGKTSLLQCLTGWLKVTKGEVIMENKCLHTWDHYALSCKRAVLSQSTPIGFPFTVEDIVFMGRSLYGYERSYEDREIVREALESVEMWSFRDRLFPTLSGGEQRRVHLARIFTQVWCEKKAYIFLDEPISSLDLKYQHHILSLMSRFLKEKGWAICLVIHDISLAVQYANRVALLHKGKVVEYGTPVSVLSPRNIQTVFDISPELLKNRI